MFKTKTAMLVCILAAPIFAQADGTTSLKKFYDDTNSISANFHQVVTDTKGQKIQDVVGAVSYTHLDVYKRQGLRFARAAYTAAE